MQAHTLADLVYSADLCGALPVSGLYYQVPSRARLGPEMPFAKDFEQAFARL